MDNKNIVGMVHNSMYHQLKNTGFATPIQVLIDLQVLSKEDYEKWRVGKIDYLERVCKVNLSKLSAIMKEIRGYAQKNNLKPSYTYYKQWGQKKSNETKKLRFSKTNKEEIEKSYATHYISPSLKKGGNLETEVES